MSITLFSLLYWIPLVVLLFCYIIFMLADKDDTATTITLHGFKKELRDISLLDILRSKILKTPVPSTKYCEVYDKFLDEFISAGVVVTNISRCRMTLKNNKDKEITIWCGNYPYYYGGRIDTDTNYTHYGVYPSWKTVIKLREIQLTKKKELLDSFIAEKLKG